MNNLFNSKQEKSNKIFKIIKATMISLIALFVVGITLLIVFHEQVGEILTYILSIFITILTSLSVYSFFVSKKYNKMINILFTKATDSSSFEEGDALIKNELSTKYNMEFYTLIINGRYLYIPKDAQINELKHVRVYHYDNIIVGYTYEY